MPPLATTGPKESAIKDWASWLRCQLGELHLWTPDEARGSLIRACAYARPARVSCAELEDPKYVKRAIKKLLVGHILARAPQSADPINFDTSYPAFFDIRKFRHVNSVTSKQARRLDSQVTLIQLVDIFFALHGFNEYHGLYGTLSGYSFPVHDPGVQVERKFADIAICATSHLPTDKYSVTASRILLRKTFELFSFL